MEAEESFWKKNTTPFICYPARAGCLFGVEIFFLKPASCCHSGSEDFRKLGVIQYVAE